MALFLGEGLASVQCQTRCLASPGTPFPLALCMIQILMAALNWKSKIHPGNDSALLQSLFLSTLAPKEGETVLIPALPDLVQGLRAQRNYWARQLVQYSVCSCGSVLCLLWLQIFCLASRNISKSKDFSLHLLNTSDRIESPRPPGSSVLFLATTLS